MAYLALFVAGLFEIVWVFAMKQSEGFTRLWPSLVTVAAMCISFFLLATSLRSLPLGTAYAIWTGIGAAGAFVVGVIVFGESASPLRIAAAAMIVCGLVLMKLSSPA